MTVTGAKFWISKILRILPVTRIFKNLPVTGAKILRFIFEKFTNHRGQNLNIEFSKIWQSRGPNFDSPKFQKFANHGGQNLNIEFPKIGQSRGPNLGNGIFKNLPVTGGQIWCLIFRISRFDCWGSHILWWRGPNFSLGGGLKILAIWASGGSVRTFAKICSSPGPKFWGSQKFTSHRGQILSLQNFINLSFEFSKIYQSRGPKFWGSLLKNSSVTGAKIWILNFQKFGSHRGQILTFRNLLFSKICLSRGPNFADGIFKNLPVTGPNFDVWFEGQKHYF